MYERCLNEVELILSASKEPLIPVKEIWDEVVRRSKLEGFEVAALADFTAMLEADKRFQIIPAKERITESGEGNELDLEMEKLGFYPEDRVRLRMAEIEEGEIAEEELIQKQELEVGPAEKEIIVEKPKIKEKKVRKMVRRKKTAVKKKTAKATRSMKKRAKSLAKKKSTVKAKKSKTKRRIKR